ncbi:MAG: sulfotransferase, partial [Rhodospirillales bacterium]
GAIRSARSAMNRKQRRRQKKRRTPAAKARPAPPSAVSLMAEAAECFRRGRLDDALALIRRVLDQDPGNADIEANLGNVLSRMGKTQEAAEAYGRALAADPDNVPVLGNLAILKAETGERDEAVALHRRVLALDPGDAETYHDLSVLKTFAAGDPDIGAMEALRARPSLPDEKAMFLDFALAKALDDTGDFERAFAHMASANRLKRTMLPYDAARDEALVERIVEVFDQTFFEGRDGEGAADGTPIFIVGMPRSGTTLVEQVLASHSQVFGAGELNHFRDAVMGFGDLGPGLKGLGGGRGFPEGARDLGPSDVRRLGEAYVQRLCREAPGAARVTDKMPRNFFFLGLIHLTLPGAAIVHCVRDPMATCLSCYQIHFPGGQEFAYDLADLGRYYRLYARLIDHWRRVLPGRILDVRYEDLVAGPEAGIRALLDFCGLGWEEACLRFHEAERQVRTASAQQVRRPIYRTAVERWRRYEKHLGPLIEALGPLAESG